MSRHGFLALPHCGNLGAVSCSGGLNVTELGVSPGFGVGVAVEIPPEVPVVAVGDTVGVTVGLAVGDVIGVAVAVGVGVRAGGTASTVTVSCAVADPPSLSVTVTDTG